MTKEHTVSLLINPSIGYAIECDVCHSTIYYNPDENKTELDKAKELIGEELKVIGFTSKASYRAIVKVEDKTEVYDCCVGCLNKLISNITLNKDVLIKDALLSDDIQPHSINIQYIPKRERNDAMKPGNS